MLNDVAQHVREDVSKVEKLRAKIRELYPRMVGTITVAGTTTAVGTTKVAGTTTKA